MGVQDTISLLLKKQEKKARVISLNRNEDGVLDVVVGIHDARRFEGSQLFLVFQSVMDEPLQFVMIVFSLCCSVVAVGPFACVAPIWSSHAKPEMFSFFLSSAVARPTQNPRRANPKKVSRHFKVTLTLNETNEMQLLHGCAVSTSTPKYRKSFSPHIEHTRVGFPFVEERGDPTKSTKYPSAAINSVGIHPLLVVWREKKKQDNKK